MSQLTQTEGTEKKIKKIDDAIKYDELKKTHYEDKLVKLNSEPGSRLSPDALTFTPQSPPKVLNPYAPTFTLSPSPPPPPPKGGTKKRIKKRKTKKRKTKAKKTKKKH